MSRAQGIGSYEHCVHCPSTSKFSDPEFGGLGGTSTICGASSNSLCHLVSLLCTLHALHLPRFRQPLQNPPKVISELLICSDIPQSSPLNILNLQYHLFDTATEDIQVLSTCPVMATEAIPNLSVLTVLQFRLTHHDGLLLGQNNLSGLQVCLLHHYGFLVCCGGLQLHQLCPDGLQLHLLCHGGLQSRLLF